jgi:hypothetical protein
MADACMTVPATGAADVPSTACIGGVIDAAAAAAVAAATILASPSPAVGKSTEEAG